VELPDAGREWAASLEVVSLALGSIPKAEELAKLDTWIAQEAKYSRYRRQAFNAADLVFSDNPLRARAPRTHVTFGGPVGCDNTNRCRSAGSGTRDNASDGGALSLLPTAPEDAQRVRGIRASETCRSLPGAV
jgi:hypothetical protein